MGARQRGQPMQRLKNLPPAIKQRAAVLLDMRYKPSEFADEVGMEKARVYQLVPAGLPHERDRAGHIWILGAEAAEWLRSWERPRVRLGQDEAYCLRCKRAVALVNPQRVRLRRKVCLLKAVCPECGRKIPGARDTMIHRPNYLAVRAFLDYREDVLQRDPTTISNYRWRLRHLLSGPTQRRSPKRRACGRCSRATCWRSAAGRGNRSSRRCCARFARRRRCSSSGGANVSR